MMRSLWTGASGMHGQQFNIDTIAHNLSNVNTVGYKKNRAEFEDLLYQSLRTAGTPASLHTQRGTRFPVGVEAGLGVRVNSTMKIHTQGAPKQTDQWSDVAIFGEGFFKVKLAGDQGYAYTRNGAFKADRDRYLLTANGQYMDPPVQFPEGYLPDSVKITQEGFVTCRTAASGNETVDVGQIRLYRFVNPNGLKSVGENLYTQTEASGAEIEGTPGRNGFGKTMHKMLEMSNVNPIDSMVNLITAQRAFEMNSKIIHTSDTMLGTAVGLKR
jgi:flagellar basal-body rod protein FlgG